MKRYLSYIFLTLVSSIFAASCIEELEPELSVIEAEEFATLVPRVTNFANQYVTKANAEYTGNETKISNLTLLVFKSDGTFVYMQESNSGAAIKLNKSMLNLKEATIVMFANMSVDNIKDSNGKSLRDNKSSLKHSDLAGYTYHIPEGQEVITSLENFAGFPMMGEVTGVDLSKESTSAISVSLKILYAKVKFDISVAAGTENQGTGKFELNSYTVDKASKATTLGTPEGATVSSSYTESSTTVKTSASSFTFYVSESRYNHKCSDLSNIYPSVWLAGTNDDVKNSDDQPNGVKHFYDDLVQQYKPKLAEVSTGEPGVGLATNVTLTGKYTDYRGAIWNVNYKIYLGKDNAQNFEVDRNSEYANHITIKGIRNDNSYGEGQVWVDHRVDVSLGTQPEGTGSADDCVTITRETLIDSHIEARPLRVKWEEGKYTFARVYLPYYTQDGGATWAQRDEVTAQKKNWIGIELGDKTGSLYCSGDDNPSKGKRKYFTEALVSELNKPLENTDIISEEGQDKFIALANDQCAWIYIDEYWNDASTATNPATQDRTAKIVVEFCTIADNKISVKNREEYVLFQQPPINIDNKYYIENYEEYLYSYNSHDKYNINTPPTDYDYTGQGLQWGFTQTGAKNVSKSQFVTKNVIADWAPSNKDAYDFIHSLDKPSLGDDFKVVDKDGNNIDLLKNTGYNFTYSASANNGVSISSMDRMPESAYQYCLSKNKFKEGADGQHNQMLIRWYVPDVYELSEIFENTKCPLSDNSYYWSSQVPYNITQSNIIGTIAAEDEENARVVSKDGKIDLKARTEKHKIRCIYNKNGILADMSERTPEGIGGLMKIPMTVKDDGYFDYSQWFTDLGVIETEYSDITYRFPMSDTYPVGNKDRDEADDYFGGALVDGVHYYSKNPLDSQNWGPLGSGDNITYDAMNPSKWPGLSNKESKLWQGSETINRYQLTDKDKQITRTYTSRSGSKIDALPSNVNDIYLDHNEDSESNLKISFDKGTNNSNSPKYEYYNEDGGAARQQIWVKYWNVPEYSSKDFPSNQQKYSAPERDVTYNESELKSQIEYEVKGLFGSLGEIDNKRYVWDNTYEVTPITTRSSYSYSTASAARDAASTYFNDVINANKEYLNNPSISTPNQSLQLCSYTYKYQLQKRKYWWTDWYNEGDPITKEGTFSKTFYTYEITYQKPNGTYYRYVAGTGGWDEEETPLSEEPVEIEPEKPNVDALTFYAGNTFTISCTKPNYYIRSVKVNCNTNIIESGKTYLRFMDNSKNLPAENEDPELMTYLDGGSGWSKWTSVGDNSSVSLRLVICDMNTNSWWIGNWWNPQMTHKNPSTSTERGHSLIINSLEIRLEEIKPEESN